MRYVQQNGILVPQTSRNRQRGFIVCGPAFFGGAGSPSVTQAVWSATNKASDITLSGDAKIAFSNSTDETGGTVLSSSSKASGKFYIEVTQDQVGSAAYTASSFGLHAGTSGLTAQYIGADADGWGSVVYGAGGGTRASYHAAIGTNVSSLAHADHQTARMAVDLDAGEVWLSQFGDSSWMGGGDPSLGTSPTFIFTPSGDYYFAGCPHSAYQSLTLTDPSSWLYGPPSGFGVWTS